MGRKFTGWSALLLVAVAFTCQSAQASDRKGSSVREERAASAVQASVPAAARADVAFVSTAPERSRSARSRSGGDERGEVTLPHERKKLMFFRLDRRHGDVSVQPVVGRVNGAQLSIGF